MKLENLRLLYGSSRHIAIGIRMNGFQPMLQIHGIPPMRYKQVNKDYIGRIKYNGEVIMTNTLAYSSMKDAFAGRTLTLIGDDDEPIQIKDHWWSSSANQYADDGDFIFANITGTDINGDHIRVSGHMKRSIYQQLVNDYLESGNRVSVSKSIVTEQITMNKDELLKYFGSLTGTNAYALDHVFIPHELAESLLDEEDAKID